MTNSVYSPLSRPPGYQLLRKAQLLKKVPFAKSTLHAKLSCRSRYFDPTLPQPIYFPGSRIPYWNEAAVDAWIAAAYNRIPPGPSRAAVPALAEKVAPESMDEPASREASIAPTASNRRRINVQVRNKLAYVEV